VPLAIREGGVRLVLYRLSHNSPKLGAEREECAVGDAVVELSREEIIEIIERGARARCNMSGAELVAAYREGRLEDPGEVADLLMLADLLEDDDSFFDAA
jgi:hypothetical protein